MSKAQRIAELNDELRRTLTTGLVVLTGVVHENPHRREIVETVRCYDFSRADPSNDPYGEHDYGVVEVGGGRYYWKIDYYDQTLTYGSADPSDPLRTRRVLTILRDNEY